MNTFLKIKSFLASDDAIRLMFPVIAAGFVGFLIISAFANALAD